MRSKAVGDHELLGRCARQVLDGGKRLLFELIDDKSDKFMRILLEGTVREREKHTRDGMEIIIVQPPQRQSASLRGEDGVFFAHDALERRRADGLFASHGHHREK